MGDGDEDDSIGNLSPVTASTPMVPTGSSPMFPAGSLPISSTFQLSQTGGEKPITSTSHFRLYKCLCVFLISINQIKCSFVIWTSLSFYLLISPYNCTGKVRGQQFPVNLANSACFVSLKIAIILYLTGTTHFQNIVQDLRYKIAKEKQSARLATSKLRQISDEKQDILMWVTDRNCNNIVLWLQVHMFPCHTFQVGY